VASKRTPILSPSNKNAAPKGAVRGAVRNVPPPLDAGDDDAATTEKAGGIRAVVRTCAIIRLVSEGGEDGVSLIDLAKAVGLPKSSTHRYVQVLEGEGFVERDAQTSKYRLGIGFMSLQASHVERLVQRTRPILAKIRDSFDETVNLGMLIGNQIVYLDILESSRAMRLAARKGDTENIHATALGKAIAATLLDVEVIDLLRRSGMPQRTARTITTEGEYLHELERVRSAGYAVDDCENELEGRCVAVFVPRLTIPTAISVSGIASRFSMEKTHEVANNLRIAAMEISGENLPPFKRLQPRLVN
jgi:IclR family transcriptional regulator, acetate operon repressor